MDLMDDEIIKLEFNDSDAFYAFILENIDNIKLFSELNVLARQE